MSPSPPARTESWLSQDDAELLGRAARDMEEAARSEQGKEAAERFNEIVLLAASGKIDQAEAFRLAAELQADLNAAGQEADELKKGLSERGTQMAKHAITRDVGQALRDGQFQEAEEALRKLAERLASERETLTQKELDELRASLEEARGAVETKTSESSAREQAASQEQERLEKERERLLKKQQQGTATEADKKALQDTERRLRTLDRQKKQEKSAEQTLSELDKKLAEAARQLQEERKKSGQFLDEAADTMQKGAARQLSDAEKKEMIKQLEALKERLRRQNEEGNQAERLEEFLKRARGQKGQQGEGQPQEGAGEGQPQPGQVQVGPGGQPIPIPGQGQGQGDEPGQGDGEEPGSGKEPGHAHDPNLTGEETNLNDAGTNDTTAVAQDTGQGQSASETIVGVAEEGFTASAYENLYREYETVAEEVMDKDAVPVGRRAHVLRYFELIRPRAASPSRGDK